MKKFLYSLLVLLLVCGQSYGQNLPTPPQPQPSDVMFVIDDFSKLLYSHADPFNITHGEASDAYNVRANDQYGSLSKRTALNLLGNCRTTAVTGLHRYYKSDATKYTVTTSDQYVDYISDSGSCVNLGSGYSTGKRWSFITYKDWEIGTNGYDLPIKWDGNFVTTADTAGARSAGFLVTQLGAPFAKLAVGSGLSTSKWYQYRIAYYDGTTYKYSSSRSNPILTGATTNKQIALTDIPIGPPGITHRYIYRTLGDNSATAVQADNTFYLVTDISDNTSTTYTDSSADATISMDSVPTWATVSAGINVSPPHGIYPFIHKDYIWFGNDPSGTTYGQSTVYFSQVTNPDYWKTGTDYFLIRPDDGDVVVGVTSFLGQLCIPKTNSWSKIYTDNALTAQWQVSQPFSFVGPVAPYSIQVTPLGIFYLGRYGLYKFDGQSSNLISDSVTKDVRDINPTNYINAAGIYYNNEYRLAYSSILTGSGVNDRVLLFDLVRNSFVKDTENINVWSVYNSSDDFGALYSGSSSTDGRILAHSSQPSNLVFRYQTDLDAGTYTNTTSFNSTGNASDLTLSLGSSPWSADASAWNSESTSTWQADTSPGYWYSAITQINANALSKLYWNQVLGPVGTVSFAIRTGATSGDVGSASWSSEFTNPSGSDISGVSANKYIQIRVTLSSSDLTQPSPYLNIQDNYMIKLVYSQTGTAAEVNVASSMTSGWLDLVPSAYYFYLSNYPKTIKEIDVYYEGTAGTLNIGLQNLKGDSSILIPIDLSKSRLATSNYYGYGTSKMYRWLPNLPGAGSNVPPVGDKFMLLINENGTTPWKIQRMVFRFDAGAYRPYANQ